MPRCLYAFVALQLLCSSGCIGMTFCNGTGEPVVFHAELEGNVSAYTVDSCSCRNILLLDSFQGTEPLVTVTDPSGNMLATNKDVGIVIKDGQYVTYNGFFVSPSDQSPDFSTKSTIVFRNLSSTDVYMTPLLSTLDVFETPPHTLVGPGEFRELITTITSTERFEVLVMPDGINQQLATCSAQVVDGLEIIWDGTALTCGVTTPPTDVDIELFNMGFFPIPLVTLDEDAMIQAGADPFQFFVFPGESRITTVAAGGPDVFRVLDHEVFTVVLDECTLQDPSAGDTVVWDGVELTCIEAASAAAALEPIPDPMPEEDPLEELAAEALRLGNDLSRSARRQVRRLFDNVNPF